MLKMFPGVAVPMSWLTPGRPKSISPLAKSPVPSYIASKT
jgi:hypothetical protein